jgi:hypothetical protein
LTYNPPVSKPCSSNEQLSCHKNASCGGVPITKGLLNWCSVPIRSVRCCTCSRRIRQSESGQQGTAKSCGKDKEGTSRNVSDRQRLYASKCGSDKASCTSNLAASRSGGVGVDGCKTQSASGFSRIAIPTRRTETSAMLRCD